MQADLKVRITTFNLKYTLECGQCFRWNKINDNEYVGVISDRVIKIKQDGEIIYVWSNLKDNLKEVIFEYFDFNNDYTKLEQNIAKIDENIKKSLEYTSGIHILNQPLFETIISYIISANNNIKRISKSVNELSRRFGKEVLFENNKYYLFPTIDELSNATMDDLLACGTGFRARYILKDVKEILSKHEIINNLYLIGTNEAREVLMELDGIGPKVADCILLFALKKREVFPVDVWVKRIMEKLYFKQNTTNKDIIKYANDKFGVNAGIVQQHLFHNVREGNI